MDLVHRRMSESKGLGDRRMTDVAFLTFEWTFQKDEFIAKYRCAPYISGCVRGAGSPNPCCGFLAQYGPVTPSY